MAKAECQESMSRDYYHWITYIFVNDQFKGEGLGTQLLQHMQNEAWQKNQHSIRVDVARKAVNFFKKNRYQMVGEPWRPMAGSSYFNQLFPMELRYDQPVEEMWDVS